MITTNDTTTTALIQNAPTKIDPTAVRDAASAAAQAKLDEALEILGGPLADAKETRDTRLRAALAAPDPGDGADLSVREFARADAAFARIERMVESIRAAREAEV